MAQLVWCILCRRAVIDKYTNLLSIQEVIEELTFQPPPGFELADANAAIGIDAHLIALWRRTDPEKPELAWQTITVETPDGGMHETEGSARIDLRNNSQARILANTDTLPYRGPGFYHFHVASAEGKEKGAPRELAGSVRLTLKVLSLKTPSSSSEPEQPSEQSESAPQE